MNKYARLVSAVALTLAIIVSFSGCGIVDYARTLVKKDTTSSTEGTSVPGISAVDTNASTQTAGNTTASVKPGTSAPATTKPGSTEASATHENTTAVTESTTAEMPSLPVENEEDLTTEDIKDMPVKEVQDLLFATDDENTAAKILKVAGFEYDEKQGIYYSQMNPLQRKFGFNFVYDTAAPMAGMIYDTKRIEFEYDGKEWMIQLWKGQYGITSGAEIGLYSRDPERVMQYDCADNTELITMQFDFYNQGEYVFSRGPEKHWWLTGFKVFHVGVPAFITMDMTLDFEDNLMANAFQRELKKVAADSLIDRIEYERKGSKFHIVW